MHISSDLPITGGNTSWFHKANYQLIHPLRLSLLPQARKTPAKLQISERESADAVISLNVIIRLTKFNTKRCLFRTTLIEYL